MIPGSTIFVINDDGTGKRLLYGGSGPKWSPLGDRFAFFGSPNLPGTFLCTMRSDGSDFQKLTLTTREGEVQTASLDWSPDGKQLVFFTNKYHASGGFAVINADGTNENNLTPEGFWRKAVWSPAGTKIALEGAPAGAKQPSIYMINSDGTGMYNLVDAFAVSPLWRPDGKKIKFDIGTRQDTTQYFQYASYISNPDGSDLQRLTNNGTVIVAWSLDMSKLLYAFQPEGIANPAIASIGIMNADGSAPKILLLQDEHHGYLFSRFSPTVKKIAYVKLSNDSVEDRSTLWVMNADGSEQRKLDGLAILSPIYYDWSPK
jgi:Tol biopolymer transport system component